MQLGFVGLGRMGGNMVHRLARGGHEVVAFNRSPGPVQEAVRNGATGASSRWKDTMARAERIKSRGFEFVDCGTSGGIWGLQVGYSIMAGGSPEAFARVEPAVKTLAPEDGYGLVGPNGAGHFVKMVHNGIEYGMMQAYAEGFQVLEKSEYPVDLHQVGGIWQHGSVVRSWLLDLAVSAFEKDPKLERLEGWVDDSREGPRALEGAIHEDVPAPVITMSLFSR